MSYDPQKYEEAIFYEAGPYRNWMLNQCMELFKVNIANEPATLCDIGAGPGTFTVNLASKLQVPVSSIVCAEPQKEFCDVIRSHGMTPIQEGAAEFCSLGSKHGPFTYILMKEVVHLVEMEKREAMFAGARTMLQDNNHITGSSRLLVISRPNETLLPFFDKAKEVYHRDTEDVDSYVALMQKTGYVNVQCHRREYRCKLPLEKWCSMLRGRFWSTLFSFSEEQLEEGIQEVRKRFIGREIIEFDDVICFITGDKNSVSE